MGLRIGQPRRKKKLRGLWRNILWVRKSRECFSASGAAARTAGLKARSRPAKSMPGQFDEPRPRGFFLPRPRCCLASSPFCSSLASDQKPLTAEFAEEGAENAE